ncbi:hypothetical protein ABLV11_08100, partial [Klebsiella sp. GW_Kp181]|uniref:hypothetical protein n=1 Tax=Klebsiella sp. GW_Kp181 TaxID=3153492 RepID=UPI0032B39E4D
MYTNANSRLSIPGVGALRLSGLPNPQAARTSSALSRATANALPGLVLLKNQKEPACSLWWWS